MQQLRSRRRPGISEHAQDAVAERVLGDTGRLAGTDPAMARRIGFGLPTPRPEPPPEFVFLQQEELGGILVYLLRMNYTTTDGGLEVSPSFREVFRPV